MGGNVGRHTIARAALRAAGALHRPEETACPLPASSAASFSGRHERQDRANCRRRHRGQFAHP